MIYCMRVEILCSVPIKTPPGLGSEPSSGFKRTFLIADIAPTVGRQRDIPTPCCTPAYAM